MLLAYEAKSIIFKVTIFAGSVLPVYAPFCIYFLFRSDDLWIVEEHFWESNVPALLFDQGSNCTFFWILPTKKTVFQAKQQPLGKVMGAAWPEWGIKALLDVLPTETGSVTYQQALQSPVYSVFKCCVNIAFALPFIFVSLLSRCCQTVLEATAGLSVRACTGAHLPAGWLKRAGGEHRPRWWNASPAVHRVCLSRTVIGCSDF